MISSAHRTASAIALIVAGTLFPPSNWANLRAARILAAINRTRLRPSSTQRSLSFSPFVCLRRSRNYPILPYRPLPFFGVVAGQMGQISRVRSLANPLVRGSFASVMGKIGSPKNKLPLPAPTLAAFWKSMANRERWPTRLFHSQKQSFSARGQIARPSLPPHIFTWAAALRSA